MKKVVMVLCLFAAAAFFMNAEASEPSAKTKGSSKPQNTQVVKASDEVLAKVEALKKSLEQTRAKMQKGELKIDQQATDNLVKRMSIMSSRLDSWAKMIDSFQETGEVQRGPKKTGPSF